MTFHNSTVIDTNSLHLNEPETSTDALVQDLTGTLDAEVPFIVPDPTATTGLVIPTRRTPTPDINTGLGNHYEALFRMYDAEFCILPITSDTALNPFRCRQQISQGSRLLFHSVLALCCRHLNQLTGSWSAEALEHRSKASGLLENALQRDQLNKDSFSLLDPILIMFTLDCTLSAAGPWEIHLNRAHRILEAGGGPSALNNPRTRSQVGMFVWWDATLALVSRQGTVLSQRYLDYLIRCERKDQWSFYDLTGSPSDLLTFLFQLADLAKQSEIASTMTWLSFNLTPVRHIEAQLRNWKDTSFCSPCALPLANEDNENDSDAAEEDERAAEEALHAQQDRYHCAQAWRGALLVYIERVFKWRRRGLQPRAINRIVRETLNHVRCCRGTSQTQKQLLLPVFLAGSETNDEDLRSFVTKYCQWWGERSRYNMFNSVASLLQEVWAEDAKDLERRQ